MTLWSWFADFLFYVKIQRKIPAIGKVVKFNVIRYMVVSNSYGNRAVVLRAIGNWNIGAFLMIKYHFANRWLPWPSWMLSTVSDGSESEIYDFCAMYSVPDTTISDLTSYDAYENLRRFNDIVTRYKPFWFLEHQNTLTKRDWDIKSIAMNESARIIQMQWRKSISCPDYRICKKRLRREFCELKYLY
jgi:hypothetical protein